MKKLLSLKMLLILGPVLVLGGGIAAVILLGPQLFGGSVQIKISTGAQPAEAAAAPTAPRETAYGKEVKPEYPTVPYATRERVVNLADKGGYRYLKVEVVLDIVVPHAKPGDKLPTGEKLRELIKQVDAEMSVVKPKIEDAINSTLASKTADELMTSEGKQRLRDELRAKLDRLSETPVEAVYFTQFIIQ